MNGPFKPWMCLSLALAWTASATAQLAPLPGGGLSTLGWLERAERVAQEAASVQELLRPDGR